MSPTSKSLGLANTVHSKSSASRLRKALVFPDVTVSNRIFRIVSGLFLLVVPWLQLNGRSLRVRRSPSLTLYKAIKADSYDMLTGQVLSTMMLMKRIKLMVSFRNSYLSIYYLVYE